MGFEMGMWLLASLGTLAGMVGWHKRKMRGQEQVGANQDYSNMTMYFNPVHGEGHLFMGGILVIIFFSLFCYEFARIIREMLIG